MTAAAPPVGTGAFDRIVVPASHGKVDLTRGRLHAQLVSLSALGVDDELVTVLANIELCLTESKGEARFEDRNEFGEIREPLVVILDAILEGYHPIVSRDLGVLSVPKVHRLVSHWCECLRRECHVDSPVVEEAEAATSVAPAMTVQGKPGTLSPGVGRVAGESVVEPAPAAHPSPPTT